MHKETLNIGHLAILDHLILGIAQKKDGGHFENFKLSTQAYPDWVAIADAFEKGKIQAAFLLFPLALNLFRKNGDMKLLLLGHREGQVLVMRKDKNSIAELKGEVVGVPHRFSTHHILLHQILTQNNLSLADVTVKDTHVHFSDVVDALAKKEMSAFVSAEPYGVYASKKNVGYTAVLSQNVQRHHIDCVLVVREAYVKEHPEACQELIDSLVRAGMFITAYPRQAAEIGEGFLGWPKKLLLEALAHDKGHILYWDLLPRLEDFETLQDLAVHELKLWKETIDLSTFVDASFAGRAYREWMMSERQDIKDRGSQRTLPGSVHEAAQELSALVSAAVYGQKTIALGGKYPKDAKRLKDVPKDAFAVFDDVRVEVPVCLERKTKTGKAVCLLHSRDAQDADRVLVKLNVEGALKCAGALAFGADVVTTSWKEEDLETLLGETHPFVFALHQNDVWLSCDAGVLRLLPTLLKNFTSL